MLERFRAAKRHEVDKLEQCARRGGLPAPFAGPRPAFGTALRGDGLAVIAEYKRASPSCGVIDTKLTPEEVAAAYEAGGATAISVLTEEVHFRGELSYLARMTASGLPLLRKDFIMHPLQVTATAATPASALLLIVRLTPDAALLRDLREQAEAQGMDAVVEVFDTDDLDIARASGARIIQVNARDLDTLKVSMAACLGMGVLRDAAETWVAASGMSAPEHLAAAATAGYDAALVGTALMRGGDPGAALRALLGREAA